MGGSVHAASGHEDVLQGAGMPLAGVELDADLIAAGRLVHAGDGAPGDGRDDGTGEVAQEARATADPDAAAQGWFGNRFHA
ncbi:hypothetical protein DVJ83_15525 (plasmid) [Deinococcus wulumuqiensis]|uniref:Uncharacterized protein n=1 Tax=Deinococcus wulumuqiensis TaxID=980427 RepID=A0A345ILK6_9DEIO|nr:hypothetical protein DVJ83_15525 [Deinococcus wulumuqiensis]